jgi:thiol:disulfide interchange protein
MNLNYIRRIRYLVLSMILFAAGAACAADSINWRSYEEGMTLSKIEKKKVFLHFYADWCGFCRKMANTTFKDSTLINYLNDNFMPIMVNTDKEPETAGAYGVMGLPYTMFLTEMGEPIFSVPGFIATDPLMSMLKEINGLKTGG